MSLQQVAGGPTSQQARRFSRPVAGSGVSNKYTTVNAPPFAKTNEFPVVPFAPDSYDTLASIKGTVANSDKWGAKWMVPFTDSDAQYLLRQQAQVQNANYEKWLWQQYDVTNPAEAWIFQQIAPEQFEKRKQLILYQQNLATRYAMLRLYGVKTEEDLMLKYLVETRQVELPKGPVWAPKEWMAAQSGLTPAEYDTKGKDAWAKRYRAGMFSAMKYVNETQVGYEPDPTNRADGLGWDPANRVDEQLFVGSDVKYDSTYNPYNSYGRGPDLWTQEKVYDKGWSGIGEPRVRVDAMAARDAALRKDYEASTEAAVRAATTEYEARLAKYDEKFAALEPKV